MGLVQAAADALRKSVAEWSAARGFGDDAEATSSDPTVALDMVGRSTDPALFVLLDFHPHLKDPSLVRRLRERAEEAARRRQAIVIIAPTLVLPPELEKDVGVIDLPLPKA